MTERKQKEKRGESPSVTKRIQKTFKSGSQSQANKLNANKPIKQTHSEKWEIRD